MSDGIGVMLHQLGGGTEHSASEYYGKKISMAELAGDVIRIDFEDGKKIQITDQGQSCCESRYITTDDEPSSIIGGTLLEIEVKDGSPSENDDCCETHDVLFLEIKTDKGFITFCTHNEHNGYYGGFGLSIDEVE